MIIAQNTDIGKSFEKKSLNDILNIISKDSSIIYKNQKDIENRFLSIHAEKMCNSSNPDICTNYDINRFIKLIFDRNQFTKIEYSILKSFVTNVVIDALNHLNESKNEYDLETKMITIILSNKEELSNGLLGLLESDDINDVSSYILLSIINLYIPTDEVDEIIESILEIGITQIVKNTGDTDWIMSCFSIKPSYMKEIVLIFKILSDIYDNYEASYEFLKLYHEKYITSYKFYDDIYSISERYSKYINPNDLSCITYMIEVLGGSEDSIQTENGIKDECDDFIDFCGDELKDMPENILQCLIKDCIGVLLKNSYLNANKSRFVIVSDQISSKIKNYKVFEETPFALSKSDHQSPIEALEKMIEDDKKEIKAMEALHKDSVAMNDAEKKIYKAYRTYKESEEKVNSQITKAVKGLGKTVIGDARTEIIEGKKFSVIGLLKRVLATVGLFSVGPVKAIITLVVRYALKKKITESERRKIIMELDTEIEMITEKIEDARGDNNREAKYAMMRTKKELENAKKRIQYGMEASQKDLSNANKLLNESRQGGV